MPRRARNSVALGASLLFFAWGAPRFVFLLVAGCLFDFHIGNRLTQAPGREALRKRWLACGVGMNLLLLAYFKYANFGLEQLNALLRFAGGNPVPWTEVALPIGISFFTFQKISYLVDVFRDVAQPASGFGRYLLYVSLFPQLIAGPIVRYHDVESQLARRDIRGEDFLAGMWRFATGLAKKCLLANTLAPLANAAFDAAPAGMLGGRMAWLGLYAYALQIYFDFSGYSDMAIGLGRMLGFRFLENFDFPYISRGMAEFWRRWHISLGNFMREYLYIPLGGNRAGTPRRMFNLWLVFLLSGFWHGASWNFIIWGAWHGLWILADKRWQDRRGGHPLPAWLGVPLTFALVSTGWVFFRAESLSGAIDYFTALAGGGTVSAPAATFRSDPRVWAAMAIGTLAAFLPLVSSRAGIKDWSLSDRRPLAAGRLALRTAITLFLLAGASLPLLLGGFNPFIYFRF